MAYPKIVYPASGSPQHSVAFTYPPVNKPGPYGVMEQEAVGAISLSISGKRQVQCFRIDQFYRLTFEQQPWDDMAAWQSFIQYAVAGGSFLYYPDADAATYDEFWLEDGGGNGRNQDAVLGWAPVMASGTKMFSSFEIILRKVPSGMTHA